jgi:hypothetical protein
MGRALVRCCVGFAAAIASVAAADVPWPAEPWSEAINLTVIPGLGASEMHEDMSGAFWNPVTRRLLICRNGPSNTTSKLWALRQETAETWVLDMPGGQRAEWSGFGDFEALTQANLSEAVVFALVEGAEVIRRYSIATPGVPLLQRTWNVQPHLPFVTGLGAEGLAFVPDAYLRAGGFVDGSGLPVASTRGMGGLMLVGHQNGGRVYAFDLDPNNNAFTFVGSYLTGATETAELFLDRSSGHLLVLHGDVFNTIEEVSLVSDPTPSGRRLRTIRTYAPPTGMTDGTNLEGLAVLGAEDCIAGRRGLFYVVDDGGADSLRWFRQWPCACRADVNGSGTLTVQDIFDFLAGYFAEELRMDFNFSGTLSVQDVFDFLTAYFVAC